MLVDTDAGVDDAVALALLLSDPQIEIVGISTTQGNCSAEQAAMNVGRVLECAGVRDIPIAVGRQGPHDLPPSPHGRDGFGDLRSRMPSASSASLVSHGGDGDAGAFIARIGASRPGEVSLLALGPLSNLAGALELDRNALRNFRSVVVSGGMGLDDEVAAVRVRYPQFVDKGDTNTFIAPQAAARVAAAPGVFVWAGMNVTGLFRFSASEFFSRGSADGTPEPVPELLRAIHGKYVRYCSEYYGSREPIFTAHDGVAAAILAEPSVIRRSAVGVPYVTSQPRPALWGRRAVPPESGHQFVTALNEPGIHSRIRAVFGGSTNRASTV
ncbi:Purine nucleosidase [Hoyosella subflava DQS3-9A1]|uniref:Purine nucleosidase n=1 Tax=Hoyosella subflava (strain DSM 45089 / JCM 17490 / NBRC 109087 / DQS3-9A1) TaxID=443218 RepID=F6EPA5_HOYSD|nr:Purine nucleosidase [Hoyosella subflava DQS3-9A1]